MIVRERQVVLFASGAGSNVAAILRHFADKPHVHFPLIVTNNPAAGVIDIAKEYKMDVLLIDKFRFLSPILLDTLDVYQPDLLVLAGFLWKIPEDMVAHYRNRLVNIHPSLLPSYGGKGMYGHHVHEAVIENREKESGITIHLVNEEYDAGTVLLQKKVKVAAADTAETLAKKVLKLEHEWYPKVIESLLK